MSASKAGGGSDSGGNVAGKRRIGESANVGKRPRVQFCDAANPPVAELEATAGPSAPHADEEAGEGSACPPLARAGAYAEGTTKRGSDGSLWAVEMRRVARPLTPAELTVGASPRFKLVSAWQLQQLAPRMARAAHGGRLVLRIKRPHAEVMARLEQAAHASAASPIVAETPLPPCAQPGQNHSGASRRVVGSAGLQRARPQPTALMSLGADLSTRLRCDRCSSGPPCLGLGWGRGRSDGR